MRKKEVKINIGEACLQLLLYKLKCGITDGVTEEELDRYIEEILGIVSMKNLSDEKRLVYDKIPFEDVYKEAIESLKELNYDRLANREYLIIENEVILPTYNLYPISSSNQPSAVPGFGYGSIMIGEQALKHLYSKDTSLCSLPIGNIDEKIYETAKNVGAFYTNLMLERSINLAIEKGNWLKQCVDLDKYIFERNIATMIDSPYTKEAIKVAYYHIIGKLYEILMKNNGVLTLSNDQSELLAYAHYLNFVLPEELQILNNFTTNNYTLDRIPCVDVTIKDNEATFKSTKCVFSDPYDEWSDEYSKKEGIVNDVPAKLMEKRIGSLPKIL